MREVARAAYVYGLPTIDLYKILRDFALDPASAEFKAPPNAFFHSRALADPSDRSIVAMNVDTPYSYAWLDLRAEPVVLTMPSFESQRYVSAELLDLYTYIVGYVSPRTDGNRGGDFVVAGPGWVGEVPRGMQAFRCPTELVLVLVRTELFDDHDMGNVVALQDGMAVRSLSAVTGSAPPDRAPPLAPIEAVDVRTDPDPRAFEVLSWMLRLMPPLPEDKGVRALLTRLGAGSTAPSEEPGVREGMREAVNDILCYAATLKSSASLFGSREFFAGDHLARATGAYLGILGNAAEEFLGVGYQADANGEPFSGEHRYRITFAPGALPPVDAFWSITLYDADKHLYANEIDRYVLGSRQLPDMRRDPGGGVTIYVRHGRPDEDRVANWLPCPAGSFGLTFRTYLPRAAIRDGSWAAPPVVPEMAAL